MKKLLIILLCTLFLTACGGNNGTPIGSIPKNIQVFNNNYSVIEDGAFYRTHGLNSKIMFIDFNSLQKVPICPKPNCMHNDDNICSAIGINSVTTPFFNNDKLYYIISETEWNNGDLLHISQIMRVDLDGTNRRQIFEIEGFDLNLYGTYIVADDILYFIGRDFIFEQNNQGHPVGVSKKHYLFSFNLKTHEFIEIAILLEEDYGRALISGVFNDKIYITVSYPEDDYDPDDPAEAYNATVWENKSYSFITGNVYDSGLSPFNMVTQDYYIYTKNEREENAKYYVILRNGEKNYLDGFVHNAGGYFEGDKYINLQTGIGWDFTQNKLLTLNDDFKSVFGESEYSYEIITKHNSDYIMKRGVVTDDFMSWHFPTSYDFIRVTEEELIVE
jgi:hypothetical protein